MLKILGLTFACGGVVVFGVIPYPHLEVLEEIFMKASFVALENHPNNDLANWQSSCKY